MVKNYIPKKDTLFDLWFKFLAQYVSKKTGGSVPDWTHLPKAVADMIMDAYAAWYVVYSKTLGPHTPVDTLAKQEGRAAAEKTIRPFVNQYLRFPPVTDDTGLLDEREDEEDR
jgi:nitrous oxide reductase accessory protein NosL